MKANLVTLGLHALFFVIAVLVGIFGFPFTGTEALMTGEAVGSPSYLVLIYLVLVASESFYFGRVRAKRESSRVALDMVMAVAAALVAFIIFLVLGFMIGGFIENRIVTGIAAVILFLAIEWPIRYGLTKLTARMR